MNVLIIEDEKLAAERLQQLVERLDEAITVLARVDSVKKAVQYLSATPPLDLIFMDIQLADGLSFDIFERVEVTSPVIFTTAYNEYAIKAFKVNSIDYLLKPIQESDLQQAYAKFRKLSPQESLSRQQESIVKLDEAFQRLTKQYKSRFVVKVGEHLHFVPVEQIDCFFSRDKGTFIQRSDKRNLVIDYPLEVVEELVNPALFFRVSRKFIVNLNAIRDVVAYSNSRLRLFLKSGEPEEIIVSREKVQVFRDWLDS
ncbi:LytTR family DNA-binding domain-containing protein [Nibrella viscosa]|uniref:LytTR family DNA-binding domain-containing protein n=1 Tax=Nibrella viscosa TaxID=1084524 RepID=A0ABP8JY49_9BACT